MSQINNIILNSQEYSLGGGSGTGLTEDIKQALLNCFENVAWTTASGQTYYDALEDALYPPADLVSISAVYTQSGTVYDTDTLDSLKTDLVVTAHYDDSSTETVTTYTLSGTLAEGTSAITVTYGGKTTTFNVTVSHLDNSLYNWDFTQSLVDSKQGVTATLGADVAQGSSGLTFTTGNGAYVYLADMAAYASTQFTVEVDVTSIVLQQNTDNRFLNLSNSTGGSNGYGFYYRDGIWKWFDAGGAGTCDGDDITDMNAFNGKTVKMQIDYPNKKRYVYVDGVLAASYTMRYANSNGRNYVTFGTYSSAGALQSGSVIKAVRIYEGLV